MQLCNFLTFCAYFKASHSSGLLFCCSACLTDQLEQLHKCGCRKHLHYSRTDPSNSIRFQTESAIRVIYEKVQYVVFAEAASDTDHLNSWKLTATWHSSHSWTQVTATLWTRRHTHGVTRCCAVCKVQTLFETALFPDPLHSSQFSNTECRHLYVGMKHHKRII